MVILYASSVIYTLVFDVLMFRNLAIAEKKRHPTRDINRKYSMIVVGFAPIYFSVHAALLGLVINEDNAFSEMARWIFETILDLGLVVLDLGMTAIYVITLLRQHNL